MSEAPAHDGCANLKDILQVYTSSTRQAQAGGCTMPLPAEIGGTAALAGDEQVRPLAKGNNR